MEIEPQPIRNNNYITFTYITRTVGGYILNYDLKTQNTSNNA